MSVTPHDFLNSATELASKGKCDEMTQRNSLSRAYYAVYHRSCEFIKPQPSDDRMGTHKKYIKQLNQGANGSIERKIGARMKAMYGRRLIADYHLNDEIKSTDVAIQLNTARDLFSVIESADGGLPPSSPSIVVCR